MITELTLDKLPAKVLAKIDLQTAFMASMCVIVAERFQMFRLLHKKELTLKEICRKTGIQGMRARFFLAALVSLGLLKQKKDKYTNTELSDKHYVRERSIHFTSLYSRECMEEYRMFSVLEEMLTTGKSVDSLLGVKRKYIGDEMLHDQKIASEFTNMLYIIHQPDAKALAENLDLSGYRSVLDIAGGSGVMSIGLAHRFRHIKACVLDRELVLNEARKIIKREKLSDRISTMVGDMNEQIPDGFDVIMLCDTPSTAEELLKRIHDALPENGMIVLLDDFSSTDYTEPFINLMWQLRSNRKWLVTHQQAADNLKKAGFKSVKKKNIWADLWLITGLKRASRHR
jgi:tRNA A58 N-methylase Trm61